MESEEHKFKSAAAVGQTDLDGWMNAPCKIMGTHKVRAPWAETGEEEIDKSKTE